MLPQNKPSYRASAPEAMDAEQLTATLDQLPVTRRHARLLGVTGIGWALDAMDIGLISFVMAALIAHWGISSGQASLLGSIGFLGMAIGATLGGRLSDRFGRRAIFAVTLLVYGLATGFSALATTFTVLLVLRFIVGLGLGAELPVASTYISEFAPRAVRGRMVVILEAFWAVGWILAALIGTFIVSRSEDGWRWALAIGCVPALYALVVRWGLPESVRYLTRRRQLDRARSVVASFVASPPLRARGALYAIGPELYPGHLRGSGTGAAAGFGRLASITAPLLVPALLPLVGVTGLFVLFALAFCTAAGATFLLPETRGRQLA